MKQLLLRLEPLIWLLFGQGILIGTILLTGWVLVVGLLAPLELVYEVSTVVVANRVGLKLERDRIRPLLDALEQARVAIPTG